jgi:hypothetical protein
VAAEGSAGVPKVDVSHLGGVANGATGGLSKQVLLGGTAASGSSSAITFPAAAVATDDYYNGCIVSITGGAGAGQSASVIDYVGATKVATFYVAGPPVIGKQFATAPDNTSVIEVTGLGIIGAASDSSGKVFLADDSLTADVIAADAITAAALAADVTTELQNGLATTAALATVDGKIDTIDTNVDAILVDTGTTLENRLIAIEADTQDLQARTPAALTAAGNMKSDTLAMDGDTGAATRLKKGGKAIAYGTVNAGASTTSIPTSAFSPAGGIADQFKDRDIYFLDDTTTATLRGRRATISASTNAATPTLTVSALPATPASGDTFAVL